MRCRACWIIRCSLFAWCLFAVLLPRHQAQSARGERAFDQLEDALYQQRQQRGGHRAFQDQADVVEADAGERSEEHTSELQSLMRISYAVFWLETTITFH